MSKTFRNPHRWTVKAFAATVVLSSLSGCAGFQLVDLGEPPQLYDMQLAPNVPVAQRLVDGHLLVDEPTATAALDTDRIMVRPTPYEVQYYAGARWADRAPLLLQTGLVEAFENANGIGVARATVGLRGTFRLKGEMREYAAQVTPGEAGILIRARVNFKILKQPQSEILASRTFDTSHRTETDDLLAVVSGFQSATEQMLEQVIPWALSEMGAPVPELKSHKGPANTSSMPIVEVPAEEESGIYTGQRPSQDEALAEPSSSSAAVP